MNLYKYKVSDFSPGIMINAGNHQDIERAESALAKIYIGDNGRQLLSEITNLTGSGKRILLKVSNELENGAHAEFSPEELQKYKIGTDIPLEKSRQYAVLLTHKSFFGFKGKGASALIHWNPEKSVGIDQNGIPYRDYNPSEAFVSLAHELVHCYRMLKGTSSGGYEQDLKDPTTGARREEDRTVGIGKNANNPLSENGIRRDHGMPIRKQFLGYR